MALRTKLHVVAYLSLATLLRDTKEVLIKIVIGFFITPKVLVVNYELKYIGIEIGYIKKETGLQWKNEVEQLSKMLSALIKSRSS